MRRHGGGVREPGVPIGPLQPNTTYYWRIVRRGAYQIAVGPIWRFTTADVTVSLAPATWSGVKRLYGSPSRP